MYSDGFLLDAQHIRTLPAGTLHPLRGSKNVWDNEHDPEGGAPAADPGHAGEVGLGTPRCSSMSWQEVRLPPRDLSRVHEYPP